MGIERVIKDIKVWDDVNLLPLDEYDDLHFKLVNTIILRRAELGLTQRDLAKLSGIKQPAIARLEAFKSPPTIGTLYKLSKALGLKMEIKYELEGDEKNVSERVNAETK